MTCYYCKQPGHWKKDCKLHKDYLKSLQKGGHPSGQGSGIYVVEFNLNVNFSDTWVIDTGAETHICVNLQDLESKKLLRKGERDLRVRDNSLVSSEAVGSVSLKMPTGLVLVLDDVLCVPTFSRNIISVSSLDKHVFKFSIDTRRLSISFNSSCRDKLF